MERINAKVFLTVNELGSFKEAAVRLGYTQAGVSYIISAMEESLGIRLFVREYGGIHLTSEGEQLLPVFRQLNAAEELLEEKARSLCGLESGHVKVLVFDSIFIHWIPDILRAFRKEYPGITVEIVSVEDSRKAEEMVARREVDCGFFLHDVGDRIDAVPLMTEALKVVVAADHPLAKKKKVTGSDLGSYPYISLAFEEHTGVPDIFREYGVTPQTAYSISNDYAALSMASKGFGFCIFPEVLLTDLPYPVCCLDFDRPVQRTISIGIARKECCSLATEKFMECVISWRKSKI